MGINGLDAALSGLRTAQQQLNVISTNVSNVGTPGYTRKLLPQETVVLNGESSGVRGSPIIRNLSLDLARELWTQVSSVSFYDVQASYMDTIQQFHGDPAAKTNIAAEIAELRDDFSALSDSPEDNFLQRQAVSQASTVASKLNDFSKILTQMRNDTQNEIKDSISTINTKLKSIAQFNQDIRFAKTMGRTTAALEDQRDQAVNALAQELQISFFTRGDGVMVVQTREGVQLADENAETLFFTGSVIGPSSYYPVSTGGITIGDPTKPNSIDVTERSLNGRIGALLDMRDDVLPRQQALADEMAHKLALRFSQQGLQLFTNSSGIIPLDTAPIPANPPTVPNPTPVPYVGFASEIQVNPAVLANNALVQTGTAATDLPVQPGSNEVIRRILNFTFTDVAYQQANGTRDLRASGAGDTLQEWLGIFSENRVAGTRDLRNFADMNAILSAGQGVFQPAFPAPPINDQFNMTFEQPETGLGPITVTVSLTTAQANFPIGGAITNAADQLVAEINNQIALAGVPAGLAAVASQTPYGQIVINTRGDLDIDASFAGGMTQAGLDFLGLTAGSYDATDPYIDVQVGGDSPVRITIAPDDDETDLVAKLDKVSAIDPGVPGLGVDFAALTGRLTLRPGDSVTNPAFGGDIKITGGAFMADGTGTVGGGIAAGIGIVEALFGVIQPVTSVGYSSLTASGSPVAFRSQNLGPGADVNTGIITPSNIIDYAQKFIGRQTEETLQIASTQEDETAFRNILQERMLNESGVNIDEELAQMIVVQTAYSASARVISAIQEQFDELLRAV